MVKHVLALFPIWLLFWKPLGKVRARLLYAALAYGICAASFAPWLQDPVSREGIARNVLKYSGEWGCSWIGYTIRLILPVGSLDSMLQAIHIAGGTETLWLAALVAAGVVLATRRPQELYLSYLLFLYASSLAQHSYYCAIPMAAAAALFFLWESWAFLLAATLAIATQYNTLGYFLFRAAPSLTIHGRSYAFAEVMGDPVYPFFVSASQLCAGVLLYRLWKGAGETTGGKAPPVSVGSRRAVALVAVGGLPVFLVLARNLVAHFVFGRVMVFPP